MIFLDAARSKELIARSWGSSGTPAEEVETAAKILATTAPEALLVIQPVAWRQSPGRLLRCFSSFIPPARQVLKNVRVIPQVHKILGVR